MTFGILCEGEHDIPPLQILIGRILNELLGCTVVTLNLAAHSTGGSLNKGDLNKGIKILQAFGCEHLIVIFDLDKKKKKEARIKKLVRNLVEPVFFHEGIAFGFPWNEFEEWLLLDDTIVKRIVNLPQDKVLPINPKSNPKENLNSLIDSALREGRLAISDTQPSIYERIARESSLTKLTQESRFHQMFNELRKIVGPNCEKLLAFGRSND